MRKLFIKFVSVKDFLLFTQIISKKLTEQVKLKSRKPQIFSCKMYSIFKKQCVMSSTLQILHEYILVFQIVWFAQILKYQLYRKLHLKFRCIFLHP